MNVNHVLFLHVKNSAKLLKIRYNVRYIIQLSIYFQPFLLMIQQEHLDIEEFYNSLPKLNVKSLIGTKNQLNNCPLAQLGLR